MKRIVVAGGTGFIGRALVQQLVSRGDEVTVLTRGSGREGNPRLASWDPARTDGGWVRELEAADAVVNLAGEQAVGVRYTEARKRRLRDSRIGTTQVLVDALGRLTEKPAVLVNASGINYYGPHPRGVEVDESFGPGDDFLARLCVDWEAASQRARDYGIRVVNPRLGIVLSWDGGALPTMALPFRLFVGGPLGAGEQGVPWIHLDDAVAALALCLDDDKVPPQVNVCSPHPVSNRELSHALAKTLNRPSWFPVPAFGLKALFAEGAAPILTGLYAVPKALQGVGMRFRYEELEAFLRGEQ